MLGWFGVAIPYILLVGALWAIWNLQRNRGVGTGVRVACGVAGLALGGGLCLLRYSPEPDIVIYGAPLAFAILQREGGGMVVSPAPALVILLNVALITGLVHALMGTAVWFLSKKRPSPIA